MADWEAKASLCNRSRWVRELHVQKAPPWRYNSLVWQLRHDAVDDDDDDDDDDGDDDGPSRKNNSDREHVREDY